MDPSTKRVARACNFCRRRKRRCDGGTPQCSTCRNRGASCHYPRRSSDDDDGLDDQLKRLHAVERLLKTHSETLERVQQSAQPAQPAQTPATSASSSRSEPRASVPSSDIASSSRQAAHDHGVSRERIIWDLNQASPGLYDDEALPPLTIPLGHQTSTGNLLLLPQITQLLGDYPVEYFFRIEDARKPSLSHPAEHGEALQALPTRTRLDEDQYLQNYFETFHVYLPVLDPELLRKTYEDVVQRGFQPDDSSTALILAVLALGAVVKEPPNADTNRDAGSRYIQAAYGILLHKSTITFGADMTLSQALIMAASYFNCVVEPLMAWRLIHMASTSIQQILIQHKTSPPCKDRVQDITRMSWACFLIECDILAEFHQPRSGIEPLVDKMPFPDSPPISTSSPSSPNHAGFLAEISVRSLLNRVHHAVYFTDSLTIYSGRVLSRVISPSASLWSGGGGGGPHNNNANPNPETSLLRVCEELNHQLETWYSSLPALIQPDRLLSNNSSSSADHDDLTAAPPPSNRQSRIIRLRYWSAKQIIYRPFVLYVTSLAPRQAADVPQSVLDKCALSLHSCRMFLRSVGRMHVERTPYTYSSTIFSLACVLVLTMAAACPPLKQYVADIRELQTLAVDVLRPWAAPGSSIECAFEIASTLMKKQRFRAEETQ